MKKFILATLLLISFAFAQYGVPGGYGTYHDSNYDGTLATVQSGAGSVGQIITNTNTDSVDVYLHLFDLPVGRAISVSDYSGTVAGTVLATCSMPHNLGTVGGTAVVTTAGTTNYNGTPTVTIVNGQQFYYTETYVAVEAGTFKTLITPGTTESLITLQIFDDALASGVASGSGVAATQKVVEFPGAGLLFENDLQMIATTTLDGSTGAPTDSISVFFLIK